MMKKKLFALLLVLVLCLAAAVPVLADNEGFADEYYRVQDMAALLNGSEEEALNEKLDEISLRQNMDIIVATTEDLNGYSVREYADMLYEQCLFGYGSDKDGLILLISMEDHDWCISTCGYGITAFTDAGIEYIGEQITPDLSEGNYVAAFSSYAELCDDLITQAKAGNPYGVDDGDGDSTEPASQPLSLVWIPVALVIGFIIAKIIVGNMKSALKTVKMQTAANSYVKSGSMNITESRDMFLYHTVTKTAKSKSSSSGSSTHSSSSGTTHGGGSGKF